MSWPTVLVLYWQAPHTHSEANTAFVGYLSFVGQVLRRAWQGSALGLLGWNQGIGGKVLTSEAVRNSWPAGLFRSLAESASLSLRAWGCWYLAGSLLEVTRIPSHPASSTFKVSDGGSNPSIAWKLWLFVLFCFVFSSATGQRKFSAFEGWWDCIRPTQIISVS